MPEQQSNMEKKDKPALKENQTETKKPADFTQNTGLSRFLATTAVDDEDE